MQNFSYHTHTNSFGVYDGRDSVYDMIAKAQDIGFKKLGISNHLIFHPNMPPQSKMFFSDYNTACDIYKRTVEEIRTVSLNFNIDVKVGFEVDFFPSLLWCNLFEKMREEIKVDYYIGSTHFFRNKSEQYLMNLYYLLRTPEARIDNDYLTVYLNNYWDNIIESIKSGYFSFIAHLDVCKLFGYCYGKEWNDKKLEVIETLSHYKHPVELNTSGWNKIQEQHPEEFMLTEICKRDIPVIISDDAHCTDMLSQHFVKAEELLNKLNCSSRYNPCF